MLGINSKLQMGYIITLRERFLFWTQLPVIAIPIGFYL